MLSNTYFGNSNHLFSNSLVGFQGIVITVTNWDARCTNCRTKTTLHNRSRKSPAEKNIA